MSRPRLVANPPSTVAAGTVAGERGPAPVLGPALLVGLFAAAISLIAAAVPSAWFDEIATLEAARLPLGDLFAFLQHKDAVHGAFYVVMHGWTALFGDTEFALRMFSVLANALTAAGLVVLCARLGARRLGVIAGVIFAVLPRTTAMGIEGRSGALAAMLATAGMLALVSAATRGHRWRWGLYALVTALGTAVFLYGILILAAHLGYLLAAHRDRRTLTRWSVAAALSAVSALPLVWLGLGQKDQIAWLAGQPTANIWTVLVEPWLDASWLLAIGSIVLLVFALRRLPSVRARYGAGTIAIAAGWAFAPLILLLIANTLAGPLYTPRYLAFTTPGFALVLALAVTAFSRRALAWALVAAIALVSLPTAVAQRQPFAKGSGDDFRQTAELIAAESHPGDAVLLQNDGTATLRPRLAMIGYPQLFSGLDDVAFVHSGIADGSFYDVTATPEAIGPALASHDTVWLAERVGGSPQTREFEAELLGLGFHAEQPRVLNRTEVIKFTR